MTIERAAAKASKWWADMMRHGIATGDNGDRSNATTRTLALIVRAQNAPTAEQCDRFEAALSRMIHEIFSGKRESYEYQPDYYKGGRLGLFTDYGPGDVLSQALDEAGVKAKSVALPWKTVMFVFADHIDLGAGYGAPWMRLEVENTLENAPIVSNSESSK